VNWPLLANSLLVSGLTTLLASVLGAGVALAALGLPPRGRRLVLAGSVCTLVLPPFLVTGCWLDLLGQNANWDASLPFSLFSRGGAVWLLTLLSWPVTTLLALGAWSRLEAGQLEIEPRLRGWTLLRRVLLPMAAPALGQSVALTFVLALNNFAIPVILQVKVYPEELWLAFTTRLDEAGAWAACLPAVVAPLVLLLLWRGRAVFWPAQGMPALAASFRRQLGPAMVWGTRAGALGLLVLSLALPAQRILCSSRTWTELPNLFRAAPDTIWNSFAYAATTATASVVIGLVSWRLPIGLMLWVPFLIPGVLLGRLMIALFNGTPLSGTAWVVLLAFALRYLAPAWNLSASACRGLDRDLTDAARGYGARGWALFRDVTWPQLKSQVAGAWYVTYLLCLWDVETLVLIYPPGGETLALRSFNLLHYGHNAQVNALCVTLLALAVAPMLVWRFGLAGRAGTRVQ
jgi:ABC-type Fe3+ transport system permease subunit